MKSLNDRVMELQTELEQNEVEITAINQTLQEAQNKAKRLVAQKTSLKQILDGINANRTAIEKQREAAVKEREDVNKTKTALLNRLNKELSEEQRQDIEAVIQTVDDEIAGLEQNVTDLQEQVRLAEQAAAEAKAHAAELEATFGQAQAKIRQLPGQIQAAKGQVSKFNTAAKMAANDGQVGESYFLAKELEKAITQLNYSSDPSKAEAQLGGDLVSQWQALRTANDEANDKAETLAKYKQDLAVAEKEFLSKVQERQATIKGRIAAGLTDASKSSQPIEDKSST